jgi:hypothetical protein
VYARDKRYKDTGKREEHLRKGKHATNILSIPSLKGASTEKVGHPTQKPFKLIRALVESSTCAGDMVLDPFFGSGTTGVVCARLGRPWTGVERHLPYCGMALKRLLDEAGTAPPLIVGSLRGFSNASAEQEGWGVFLNSDTRRHEIQRLDEEAVFASDEQALAHVRERAGAGSFPHKAALELVQTN